MHEIGVEDEKKNKAFGLVCIFCRCHCLHSAEVTALVLKNRDTHIPTNLYVIQGNTCQAWVARLCFQAQLRDVVAAALNKYRQWPHLLRLCQQIALKVQGV